MRLAVVSMKNDWQTVAGQHPLVIAFGQVD
jgi:hypothetical protein